MEDVVLDYVENTNCCLFVTGKAGTGKTTLLKKIIQSTNKNAVVSAPTGIAAIHAGGQTLHSLLQIPPGIFIPDRSFPLNQYEVAVYTPANAMADRKISVQKRQLIQELELLIIDEVSMMRADLLDFVDYTLQSIRKKQSSPFGGVQIVFFGDLLQLPPVIREQEHKILQSYYKTGYFFEAHALADKQMVRIDLTKNYRQQDKLFIDLLNRLREQSLTEDDLEILNNCYTPIHSLSNTEGYINITTHNKKADQINERELNKLLAPEFLYTAKIKGEFPLWMLPASQELVLKKEAQVMFIKNDPSGERKFYNGKIAKVTALYADHIYVKSENESPIMLKALEWENISFRWEDDQIVKTVTGTFSQLPVRLAWAITVHKSQGLTFNKAILDIENTFAPGQMYVALSRLTSMSGLILTGRLPRSLPERDNELAIFENQKPDTQELFKQLKTEKTLFLDEQCRQVFSFSELRKNISEFPINQKLLEDNTQNETLYLLIKLLEEKTTQWNTHGQKFLNQITLVIKKEEFNFLCDRLEKAHVFFKKELIDLWESILVTPDNLTKKKDKSWIEFLTKIEQQLNSINRKIIKLRMLAANLADIHFLPVDEPKLVHLESKKDKQNTAVISYKMFMSGKSVVEIAKERGFVETTIYGHLAKWVASGELSADNFVSAEKLHVITTLIMRGLNSSSELKSQLGDDYSYWEISIAKAHMEFQNL